ncbi:MAG: Ig-like domain-containing protein [Gammaproteobacteria bacterium]
MARTPTNQAPIANDLATNVPPVANNDTAGTTVNTPVTINVVTNDTDANGNLDPTSVAIAANPANGTAVPDGNGGVTYTPNSGFFGTDGFTYTVNDSQGATSNVATVTVITVQPANVPPVANNDSAATGVNTPIGIDVVANDTDANGSLDPATVAIVSNPANGAVVNNLNGTVTYTPSPGFFGTDSFTYTVNDTQGATSNTATVTIGVNAAPAANAGPDANAVTGQPVALDGSGSSDPNGDTITFSWRFLSVPSTSGLVDTDIVNATTPAPSFTSDIDGAYELELTVTDPGALSDTDTVIITAATPNVAPNADAGLDQNADVLTLVTLNGSGTDPDNGPDPITFQWTFAQVPLGSTLTDADITNATNAQASFTPDVTGLYRLTVTVSDGDLSDTDDVDITSPRRTCCPTPTPARTSSSSSGRLQRPPRSTAAPATTRTISRIPP